MNSASASLRTLEALRTRCEQDEKRCEEQLVEATRGLDAAKARTEAAVTSERQAHVEWQRARHGPGRVAASAQRIAEQVAFTARRREEWTLTRDAVARAREAESKAEGALAAARLALGEARGRREAVEKRMAAERSAIERKAEARAEDEIGDRAGLRRGRA